MLTRFLIALAALLMPLAALTSPARAQPDDLAGDLSAIEGQWDFRIDGTTIFRFTIEPLQDGEWRGQWQRPDSFNTDGNNFGNITGGVKTSPSMTGIEFLGMVELAFDDPRPGAVPDIFRFRQTGPDSVEMTYVGTNLAPYPLVRAAEEDRIGNWQQGRVYRRGAPLIVTPAPAEVAAQPAAPPPNVPVRMGVGGPQVRFLDLRPRAVREAEAAERAAAEAPPVTQVEAQVAPEDDSAQAPAEPETEPETDAAPESARPRIEADFLDDL